MALVWPAAALEFDPPTSLLTYAVMYGQASGVPAVPVAGVGRCAKSGGLLAFSDLAISKVPTVLGMGHLPGAICVTVVTFGI